MVLGLRLFPIQNLQQYKTFVVQAEIFYFFLILSSVLRPSKIDVHLDIF